MMKSMMNNELNRDDAKKMVLTVSESGPNVKFGLAGSGDARIDWGDGKSDAVTLGAELQDISHDYPDDSAYHTITIVGTEVTGLDCQMNNLTSLDVSENTALEELECADNKLTSLDVSRNTMLELLDCSANQFSVEALNDMFAGLRDGTKEERDESVSDVVEQDLFVVDNPGTEGCDETLAVEKGWWFQRKKNK